MPSFDSFVQGLLVTNQVTEQELTTAIHLLKLYAPLLRQSVTRIEESSAECYVSRQQSVADFINLAIDYDHDKACQRLVERLQFTGRTLSFFEIMDTALLRVRNESSHGDLYYRILRYRYFDKFCHSNEDACLSASIAPSTFYRHIKDAQKLFASILWHIVIPDYTIKYSPQSVANTGVSSVFPCQ